MDVKKNNTKLSENVKQFYGKHCTLGIDEAGRGPVLGPMVYGIGICLTGKLEKLRELGVADSKALTEQKREEIFDKINADVDCLEHFAYILEILSPNFISVSMQQRAKYNLNEMSHDTAIRLIELCISFGIVVDKIYIDTVGPAESYQKKLEEKFPRLEICVSKKADSLYPIVSAASICAKVTRDKLLNEWKIQEFDHDVNELPFGSGYPGDPVTKSFLEKSLDPVFGFPTLVRFSWSTTQEILDNKAVPVLWEDDEENGKPPAKKSRSLLSFITKNGRIEQLPKHAFFEERKLTSLTFL